MHLWGAKVCCPAASSAAFVVSARLRLGIAAAAALLTLALPALAQANGSPWGRPVTITTAGSNDQLSGPFLGSDAAGDQVMAWELISTDPQSGDSTYSLQAASRQSGGSWGPAITVEGPDDGPIDIGGVSVDSSGSAMIAYDSGSYTNGCSTQSINLATRTTSGGWAIHPSGFQGILSAFAANPEGDVVLGWESSCATGATVSYDIAAASYTTQSGWGPEDHLYGDDIDTLRVAIDPAGDAAAIVLPYGQTGPGDWLAAQETGGAWSATQTLSVPQAESGLQLAMTGSGQALAVCGYCAQSGGEGESALGIFDAPSGQAFGSLQTVSTPDPSPWNPFLNLDSAGDATLVWSDDSNATGIYTVNRSASGSWGTPAMIQGSSSYEPQGVAEDASGDLTVLAGGGSSNLAAFYRPAGGSFGAVEPLSLPSQTQDVYSPEVVIPDDGVPTSAADITTSSGDQEIVAWDRQDLQTPTITEVPPVKTNQTSATFAFATPDQNVTFQCRLDGSGTSGFTPCGSPDTVTGAGNGEHTFYVREVEGSGAPGPVSSQTWTVDTTPPVTSIDSGPIGDTDDTDVTFTFSSSKPNSSFDCSLDGGAAEPCQSPQTYGGLALGSHSLKVTATDALGNADPHGATRSFTVVAPSAGGTCGVTGLARDADGKRAGSCGVKCPSGSSSSARSGPFAAVASAPSGCFSTSKGLMSSHGPLEVDGLRVTLPKGVTLSVGKCAVSTSAPARLDFGPLQSVTIKLNWKVPCASKTTISLAGKDSAFSRQTSGALASPVLSGMKIKADASLVLNSSQGTSTLGFGLKLPTSLSAPGAGTKKAQLTVQGQLILANGQGPTVKLHAGISKVLVHKLFELDRLSVDYDSAVDKLEAHGGMTLPGGRSVSMDLDFAGGLLTSYSVVANPELPIPPDTCLTELKVAGTRAFGDTPTSLELGGGVSFGLPVAGGCDLEPIRVNGSVKLEYAGSPLKPSTIIITGTGAFYSLQVANLTATWDVAEQKVTMEGTLGLKLPAVAGSIAISDKDPATYSVSSGAFDIHAKASLQLHIPALPSTLSSTVHIDNKGIVACTAGGVGFSVPWGGGVASIRVYPSKCSLDALG